MFLLCIPYLSYGRYYVAFECIGFFVVVALPFELHTTQIIVVWVPKYVCVYECVFMCECYSSVCRLFGGGIAP